MADAKLVKELRNIKSDRSHVVLCAKELNLSIVFLRPLGLRLIQMNVLNQVITILFLEQ